MKMRRFLMDTLTRDKNIEQMEAKGIKPHYYVIKEDTELLDALAEKIGEKFEEVFDANNKEELIKELASLESVIDEFKTLLKIDQSDINKARSEKHSRNGGYTKRFYLEYVDVQDDSPELKHFMKNPEKTPELAVEKK